MNSAWRITGSGVPLEMRNPASRVWGTAMIDHFAPCHHPLHIAIAAMRCGSFMPSAAPLISLPAGDIHLWFCFHGKSGDATQDAACRALLTPEELSKQNRFHFASDRYRYLLTRALVRSVLSRYAPVQPHAWRFATGPFGRPRIEAPTIEETHGLDFNLSHTDGLIVLALARNIELGVDVENIERNAALDVADHFFSPVEAEALRALSAALQTARFFDLWTLKESYIKARGMGLQIPLDSFSFTLDDHGGIEFALADSGTRDNTARPWHFWQLQPTQEHFVALCAAPENPAATRIVCREAAPLQWEKPLELHARRTSAPN
ncbi:4'-phosphopantetheinyl transferase superfamily protein [Variovorax sp. EL159]|uniref:4'-phosphopantetheinyl transferase family protein n=1 Tax=Variovorax sp. EL159 TaxID=1566270 RepID=UPI000882C383|nr:4'-phosphopantetheinyl transferase superfamily protein [Variovorax sp. EL159]SCX59698.1 4'-phosphopantetheinyl transferase [Variovorax sp. EL159]